MRCLLLVGLSIVTFFFFWGMFEIIFDLFYRGSDHNAFSWRLLRLIMPANFAVAVFRGMLIRQAHQRWPKT